MKCIEPFTTSWGAFGCGRCLPCRMTRTTTWAHRILLEAIDHGTQNCSFVTLTYAGDPFELNPQHVKDWLKRFRRRIEPRKVRYFLCGEYGDRTQRPHYHVALFGWPPCSGGVHTKEGCSCRACSVVRETWGYGHVMVGTLGEKSAKYIAGYCTKKMTHRLDTRLGGRHPEFARMSLKPGIGADAMWNVASVMMQYRLDSTLLDVPTGLRYGGTVMPLGKYLRRKLRSYIGREEKAPLAALQKLANQMQIVRSFAWSADRSVSSVFQELNQPREAQLQARLARKQRSI